MRVVRREVIMKIKSSHMHKAAEVEEALAQIRKYALEIPDVQSVSVGRAGDGVSALLVVTVADQAALERYSEHPAREKMVQVANDISEDFVIMDYIRSV